MKIRPTWFCAVIVLLLWTAGARAQLRLVPDQDTQWVFAGDTRHLSLVFSNAGGQIAVPDLRARLVQTTSATAVMLGETPWKKLTVLPGQTVLESAALDFPAVRAEMRFIIRWMDGTNKFIGTTDVLVYPTNLLKDLKSLAGENPVGVFDPQNVLKPLLKNAGVEFENLDDSGVGSFGGKFAIIGPFAVQAQMRDGLGEQIQSLAKKNIAVVWLQPPLPSPRPSPIGREREKLQPSFYSVPSGETAVVIVQPDLVANLADNPQAQLNLIRFCELALHPEPAHLPHLTEQP